MTASLDCREIDCWQELVNNTASPDQRERCERHLQSCPVCQARLDQAQACGEQLRGWGRRAGDPTAAPADPTLSGLMKRILHGVVQPPRASSDEAAGLSFLTQGDRPRLLGRFGPYEVRRVIGRGSMGIVLEGFEPALNRAVAIKVMAPHLAGNATARQRFLREARAAAVIHHENVVPVHAVGQEAGLPYLVMQYVAGESLQDRLDRQRPLEVAVVVRIGSQTARGLAAAHARGLIHRDVKPANLLLAGHANPDGTNGTDEADKSHPSHPSHTILIKITDFGLARMVNDVSLTQSGVIAGTPEYMAPEQARGEVVDHRTDLFSLGSVLYALCAGHPPFRGSTTLEVLRQVCEQTLAPVRELNPNVPAWLEEVIHRLLAKQPAERYSSAAEVAELLEGRAAVKHEPGKPVAARTTPSHNPARISFRLCVLVAVGMLAVSLGAAGAMQWWTVQIARQSALPLLHQDFRGGKPPEEPLKVFGPDADKVTRTEEGGFRITLSAARRPSEHVGLVMTTPVEGDFTITAGYEILHVDQAKDNSGGGFELYIMTRTPTQEALACSRTLEKNGAMFICSHMAALENGKRGQKSQQRAGASSAFGRLRLARTGTVAIFSASEDNGPFREVGRFELGGEELKMVRLAALAGRPPVAVDLLIKDLEISKGGDAADSTVAPTSQGSATPPNGDDGLMVAVWIIGLLFAGSGLAAAIFYLRRRRAGERTSAVRPAASRAGSESAPGIVSVRCSGCGKTLKGNVALVGKKVKCPQCGEVVHVQERDAL